jgi:hypothetical protein
VIQVTVFIELPVNCGLNISKKLTTLTQMLSTDQLQMVWVQIPPEVRHQRHEKGKISVD